MKVELLSFLVFMFLFFYSLLFVLILLIVYLVIHFCILFIFPLLFFFAQAISRGAFVSALSLCNTALPLARSKIELGKSSCILVENLSFSVFI